MNMENTRPVGNEECISTKVPFRNSFSTDKYTNTFSEKAPMA